MVLCAMDNYVKQIVWARHKNDELRTTFRGGTITVSETIRELGETVVAQSFAEMALNTRFSDSDHSSGWFLFCSRIFRWEITREGNKRSLYLYV